MTDRDQMDSPLAEASNIINSAIKGSSSKPIIKAFFDKATNTISYVIHDANTKTGAIIDSVLDYECAAGRTSFSSADTIIEYVKANDINIAWQMETHAHADHLSAAPYLQEKLGGKLAIGADIKTVQEVFGKLFNAGSDFERDGSQFDHLFTDGEIFQIGEIKAMALHVPGHTPADMAFIIGDAAFIGDTMFMPDFGTARTDFPGGDARQLFRSIKRLLVLPSETRIFLCHDYKAPGRDEYAWETTVDEQRNNNVHVKEGVEEDAFVEMRNARDRGLDVPKLIMPSVQVNIRGGHLPEPEDNGIRYMKIPVNAI